jgi:hypothetical protein
LALKRNANLNLLRQFAKILVGVPPPPQAAALSDCALYLSVALRGCRFHPSRMREDKIFSSQRLILKRVEELESFIQLFVIIYLYI